MSAQSNPSPRRERRRYERTQIALSGRYMTLDGAEQTCVTVDVSAGGVRFKTPGQPHCGETVIAYVEELGRLEGTVARQLEDGFSIALRGTQAKAERMHNKIQRLRPGDDPASIERRLMPRLELDGARVLMRDAEGVEHLVELVDISSTGFAFRSELAVAVGDLVEVGAQKAKITRLFAEGAAAKFL